jgi:hypothetical protein
MAVDLTSDFQRLKRVVGGINAAILAEGLTNREVLHTLVVMLAMTLQSAGIPRSDIAAWIEARLGLIWAMGI